MTQFNKEKGYVEIEQLKSLNFKIQEGTKKEKRRSQWKSLRKKENNMLTNYTRRQIIYINQRHLPTKVTPVLDFTD